MDALALLCTLHADGPATLKRLRQVGCTSLEELQSLEIERLAGLLNTSPAAAKRFLREAKSLGERVGRGLFDREDPVIAPRAMSTDSSSVIPAIGAMIQDASGEHQPNLGAREQEIVDKVLQTWRERDQQESTWSESGPVSDVSNTAEPDECIGSAIKPGTIDGLDEHASALLGALGIGDLESLARIDALDMSRRTGIGYTKLARLRFLAAREARTDAARSIEPRTETLHRASTTPARDTRNPHMPVMKFSMSEKPCEASTAILDIDRDLHASPRAPLPVGTSRSRASTIDAQGERSGTSERSGGPFV